MAKKPGFKENYPVWYLIKFCRNFSKMCRKGSEPSTSMNRHTKSDYIKNMQGG